MNRLLSILPLLFLSMLFVSCGDPYPDRPVRKKKDQPAAPQVLDRSPDSDQKDWIIESTKKKLRDTKSELKTTYEQIEDLKVEVRSANVKTDQAYEALEKQKKLCRDYSREVQRLKTRNKVLSIQARDKDMKIAQSDKTLQEWNSFYADYEKEVQQYKDYIAAQEEVIRQLESIAESRPETVEQEDSSLLERLVPDDSNLITRRQFYSIVQGMTSDELRSYLGSPDSVEGSSPEYYTYKKKMTYSADPAQPDSSVKISIQDGAVKQCFFSN